MTKRVIAVIPARGGSKGLPKKNILDLNGKPLIAWSIEASISSSCVTKTLVSSDSEEILEISKKYGADVLKRPDELATDTASSELAVYDAIEKLKDSGEEFDYLILLQPTSPLRDANEIENAFKLLTNSDATALISVSEIDNKILKAFKENKNGYIEGVSNNTYPFARRQDLPNTYISNGAIYIIKIPEFLNSKTLFTDKTIAYKMDEKKSLDIDSLDDMESAKRYMNEDTQ